MASERRFTSLKVAKSASIGEPMVVVMLGRRLSCMLNRSWRRYEGLYQTQSACTGSRYVVKRLGETPIAWLGNVTGTAAVWQLDVGRSCWSKCAYAVRDMHLRTGHAHASGLTY